MVVEVARRNTFKRSYKLVLVALASGSGVWVCKVFTLPYCIAEVVHASCASKRLLCIHVEFQDMDNDPRAFKFPHDVDSVTMQWQELVDETGEEVHVMQTKSSATDSRPKKKKKRRNSGDLGREGSSGNGIMKVISHQFSRTSHKSESSGVVRAASSQSSSTERNLTEKSLL
eukprot:6479563-Amphidinium_carterae.1